MGTYIIRRVLWTVLLLFLISSITFGIFNLLPSADPALLRAGKNPTPDAVEAIREQLGLDKSKPEQFKNYMERLVFHFDFGRSYVNNVEVKETIFDRLPNTLYLISGAAIIWFLAGIVIGTISAIKRGSILDRLMMGGALVLISAPVYWLGLVVTYLFSNDLGKFPLLPGVGAYGNADGFFDKGHALIMPWLVLASAFAAIYARLLRSNMLEVMGEDYIRTARAKGLPGRSVIRHGLRSAITPLITVLGLDVGILVGGAILTESVFSIQGIGRLSFDAISRGDLQMIQGTTLFLALAVCLASLVVDILYAFLDPRVRY
ncbi:Glutathione transport system permease protein GsiC [Paraconexibacter sp. AEG42_29]|uniref:Glutathione transport system permease protein GsiC n=1 Tax=Paraconexibacter sp. AEG42_29 TaxID=2997339 RepID=A0AAU7B314_9ACTN